MTGVHTAPHFGVAPTTANKLFRLFEATPGIERVWIYGSRARGDHRNESDIDLMADAPEMSGSDFSALWCRIEELALIYRIDFSLWQSTAGDAFRKRVEADRKVFWEPPRYAAHGDAAGAISLKGFQREALKTLSDYLAALVKYRAQAEQQMAQLRVMEGADDLLRQARDYPGKTWEALRKGGLLPATSQTQAHASRWTGGAGGAGEAIPNVCLKVPTGGGKTLLAAAAVGQLFNQLLQRSSGLVLWVVPNEAIFKQTWKTLSDRDHPYRQLLNVAGAGRVKLLDKTSPLQRIDVESHLCVMVLMLQSASRQSKETLRFFRDRGNIHGFFPREDDIEAHWGLLQRVPNLDVYAPFGISSEDARATKGSIIKESLGNVMRLVRPVVVMDEGHHAYTETALATLDGFNPAFLLELSATPRGKAVDKSGRTLGSNILVDVRGNDLDEAEMIKLPINVEVKPWSSWQACLAAAVERLDGLKREAEALQAESARYIRPILLVQVERTGKDQRDSGSIHAEDAKAFLLQLGFAEAQIAIKTSEQNDLAQPENLDLLSPACEVRAIITKQALSEGWDCPFAYVLCALAAGRSLTALTQLTGRILRQPQTAKTSRAALNECHVLCNDATTAEVVTAIKKSLSDEGMEDLASAVRFDGGSDAVPRRHVMKRRAQFAKARIFLPRVTWVESESGGAPGINAVGEDAAAGAAVVRRPLEYESDVLASVDWHAFDAGRLLASWAPAPLKGAASGMFGGDPGGMPEGLDPHWIRLRETGSLLTGTLDRARLTRALIDIAPNPWHVWPWIETALKPLVDKGFDDAALAASTASMIETLRANALTERDRLAEARFLDLVAAGHIEFALRADAQDYELPMEIAFEIDGRAEPLTRDDARVVDKSLFEPFIRNGMNDFESSFACYLDDKTALEWWHRNVARRQYGLQGWKRDKVFPDFVFAVIDAPGAPRRVVVMETKGAHLAGNQDTLYKQALLQRLSALYADKRGEPGRMRGGEFTLDGGGNQIVLCDLLLDTAWRGAMDQRYFSHNPG